jgi:hypothetical protein
VESDVEQSLVPITVERLPGEVIKITTNEDLKRGEYALVFRKKDPSSVHTANVALKATARQVSAPAEAAPTAPTAGSFPGMTPEMMAQMSPDQIAAMQQMQQGQAQPAQPRGGMFGGLGRKAPAAPPTPAPTADASAGFLAWDFRVLP